MNYTLRQLEVFVRIVETLSITKASEELHMTQPAVSIQLKNFQDQFEIPLTGMQGRQLFITAFGQEIYQLARNILGEVEAINYKTLAYKGLLTGRLHISLVSTGKYIMPYFLTEFISQHPGVDLKIDVTNKSGVLESLQERQSDFALISVMPENIKVEEEKILHNRLFVVTGKNDHDIPDHVLNNKEIASLPLIFREEGSGTRHVMEQYFKKHKINVRKKMELATNEAVKQAVIAGLGCSILPVIGIRNELQSGDLRILPAKGFPIHSEWRLVWLSGQKLSPAAAAYLQFIKKNKKRLASQAFGDLDIIAENIVRNR